MEIYLNIIIDNTLVRNIQALKALYITGNITLKQKYGKPQKVNCLCCGFTAQSTQRGHVKHGQFI